MRIELTQDTSVLLTKGNRYTARQDVAGQVKIVVHTEHTIPAEFYRVVEFRALDGTLLEEGKVYDLTYTQAYGVNRGKVKRMRGWTFLWASDEYGRTARFVHRGDSRYGGKRQEIELKNLLTATVVGQAEKENQ